MLRCLTTLILVLFTITLYSQATYFSPFTHIYPTIFTDEIKKVDRLIYIEYNSITIATEVQGGKEIEVLNGKETDYNDCVVTVLCTTQDNRKFTIVLPKQKQVEIIDYYSISPVTEEEFQLRSYIQRIHLTRH